jgi:hypothetical protein
VLSNSTCATTPRAGEQRSEEKILIDQRDAHVLECFADVHATKDPDTGAWTDSIVKEYPRLDEEALAAARAAEAAEEAEEERVHTRDGHDALVRDVKVCPGCDVPFFKSKTKCFLCDAALHGIDEYRAAAGGEAAECLFVY